MQSSCMAQPSEVHVRARRNPDTGSRLQRRGTALAGLLLLGVCNAAQPDDTSAKLPFSIGEKLSYDVMLARGARVGDATMWIEGPAPVRGTSTYVLCVDSRVRLALFTGVSRSGSWLDPVRKSSLCYFKRERSLL